MNNMFYSEEDLRNIISKREMCEVNIAGINAGDDSVMVKIDGDSWRKYSVDEFVKYAFNKDGISASTEDGGIITYVK